MNNVFQKTILCTVTAIALSACGGSKSSSNQNHHLSKTPALKTLEKEGKLAVGVTLKAKSTCDDCEGFSPVYTWIIDKNNNGNFGDEGDLTVSKEEYTFVEEDLGVRVRLEAFLSNTDGTKTTEVEHVEYQPSIVKEYSTFEAQEFARYALKSDGTLLYEVLNPLPSDYEGTTLPFKPEYRSEKFNAVYVENGYFLAEKIDGSIVNWGQPLAIPAEFLPKLKNNIQNVVFRAYTVAILTKTGQVFSWHTPAASDISVINDNPIPLEQLKSGVKSIHATGYAFAALKTNGDVITWGLEAAGGKVPVEASKNISDLVSLRASFAAVTNERKLVNWGSVNVSLSFTQNCIPTVDDDGNPFFECEISFDSLRVEEFSRPPADVENIKSIYPVGNSVLAVRNDYSTVAWGEDNYSQPAPPPQVSVTSAFYENGRFLTTFDDNNVYFARSSFSSFYRSNLDEGLTAKKVNLVDDLLAVILTDKGQVVFVGNDAQSFQDRVERDVPNLIQSLATGVKDIQVSRTGILALKEDGELLTWVDGPQENIIRNIETTNKFIRLESHGSRLVAIGDDGSFNIWSNPPSRVLPAIWGQFAPTETKTSALD